MTEFAVADTEPRRTSRVVKSAVTPRPIAWVSTRSEAGVANLASFSSYTHGGSDPPVVMIDASRRDRDRSKYSAENALDTGEFAVNVVTESVVEEMDHTPKPLRPEESEFDLAGVERAACRRISPPRVADAVVTMECTVHESVEIYDRVPVFGDVMYVHVDESVLTDGEIAARKMDTVGRPGGPYYTVSRPMEFERRY
jgi:flavin reductase (DIM6/NTAB) family NADH-FMN oxidoreductase RutF